MFVYSCVYMILTIEKNDSICVYLCIGMYTLIHELIQALIKLN